MISSLLCVFITLTNIALVPYTYTTTMYLLLLNDHIENFPVKSEYTISSLSSASTTLQYKVQGAAGFVGEFIFSLG